MLVQPVKVTDIIMTCALIHNFLRRPKRSRLIYTLTGSFDTEREDGMIQPSAIIKLMTNKHLFDRKL